MYIFQRIKIEIARYENLYNVYEIDEKNVSQSIKCIFDKIKKELRINIF